jgi:hypothetical protein
MISSSVTCHRTRLAHTAAAALLALLPLMLTACGKDASPVAPTPDPPATGCPSGPNLAPAGTLARSGMTFTFTTADNWHIRFDQSAIVITAPTATPNTVEFWGTASGRLAGSHENVNGKHVKDWVDRIRTVRLPSGALVTMTEAAPVSPLTTVSFYENGQSHTIDASTMSLTHSCAGDAAVAASRDSAEPDGEAASVSIIANGGIAYTDQYTQGVSATGAPLDKVPDVRPIAETGGPVNPNQVTDYWAD